MSVPRQIFVWVLAWTFLGPLPNAAANSVFFSYKNESGALVFTDVKPQDSSFGVHDYGDPRPSETTYSQVSRRQVQRLIQHFSQRFAMDPLLIEAVVKAESDFDPQALSRRGAKGLMQLMPDTAESLGVSNAYNPKENLRAGTQHLKRLLQRYRGNLDFALAAYNAGETAVTRYNGIPPYRETVDYVAKVRKYYSQLRERAANTTRFSHSY